MTKIISFAVTGKYASFRDPSVTSNQTVYFIPSKTAIIGLLGAMIGIKRSNTLGDIYSKQYLEFFSKVQIGLKLENNPQKIIYFTNHRSLKESKTKPVKKEILENPKYRIFVKSTEDILNKLIHAITKNKFTFSPYLGHAYCQAKITDLQEHPMKKVDDLSGKETDGVILDETDSSYNEKFSIDLQVKHDTGSMMIERHLHHFFENDSFQQRVLKHWIPLESTTCVIEELEKNKLSEFYKIEQMVYCLY